MGIFDRIKEKRQQKKAQDALFSILAQGIKEANEKTQSTRPILQSNQFVWESNYGLDKTNPIISESLQGTEKYLSRLCTPDGKTFTWSHYTSVRATVHGLPDVGEDKYTLCLNGQPYVDVYFVPYMGSSKYPPSGLCFTDDRLGWSERRLAAKHRYEQTGTVLTEDEQKESTIIRF